jgi:hypothetical protein
MNPPITDHQIGSPVAADVAGSERATPHGLQHAGR